MPIRLSSFHTALEQMRSDFWRKARTIVLQYNRCKIILGLELYGDSAGGGQVLEFIVEEIGNHAMDERLIRRNSQRPSATELDLQTFVRHGRFIQIDHHPEQIVQVDLRWIES